MGNVDIPNWLKGLPLAPVFRPTDTEFADPIAYISKIEKEASAFGICKIVPPLLKPSKKYVFFNLNKSLLKRPELGSDVEFAKSGDGNCVNDRELRAVFTTRQQELGQSAKRVRGDDNSNNPQLGNPKQVWQSGEVYTLEQFESKSKAFTRSQLGMIKEVSPLVVEALFWKAASQKPIYVEYANDVPGSGFGEPEGHFRHFHRRRRKRGSYQRRRESFGIERNEIDRERNAKNVHETKDSPSVNGESTSPETPKPSITPTLLLDKDSRSSRQKSVNCASDMEGTAGWKLSNSPWNLQMIARSPGSLTRFMPDDIPGVTSPMVYIGMLFSWFAWHVEDHELHSMNFLHTGSPKTWYSVPGDYAFDFEEVIRTKAYSGNIDQLAALALLGEKTTLVSPEMIVASGIPCCRLVQNPGEFVVTFPRAYHVGFSHGFNCGEAANFGTPQWLKVAKEAAVRRAAMDYLPMLSHQQLLYLLTMSFVSRVPRSLLPGARSSRLRDRQREEREFLVKKAFIEDMLNENKTLSVLLGMEPSYHMVLWDPDLLPRHSKDFQVVDATAVSSTPPENAVHGHFEVDINSQKNTLLEEMSLFMENLNDLYLDNDDDLLSDFQVDSGTLTCVACGILGFPFMSVVQPSEKALKDSLEKPVASGLSDLSLSTTEMPTPLSEKCENGWNTSIRPLRPRILCLEHTVQVRKLLQSKGGVNILVICHKDYQKIKVHATTVAEEIGIPFNYNDVPLESASQEELSLIDLAIDDEDSNEDGEDWTSELGINLHHCVKVRKNSPTKQIQHALSLCGLSPDKNPSSEFSNIKWQLRKSRSKVKPYEKIEAKVEERSGRKVDCVATSRKEEKIIQYSRRKKLKQDCSIQCGLKTASQAKYGNLDNFHGNASESNPSCDDHIQMSEMQGENPVFRVTKDLPSVSSLQNTDMLAAAASSGASLGHIENQNSDILNMETEPSDLASGGQSQLNHEISGTKEATGINSKFCAENCSSSSFTVVQGRCEVEGQRHAIKSSKITGVSCHVADRDVTDNSGMANEVCDRITSKRELLQENPAAPTSDKLDLSADAFSIRPVPTSIEDSWDGPREICAEGSCHGEELCSKMACAGEDLCSKTNFYAEEQRDIQMKNKTGSDDLASNCIHQMNGHQRTSSSTGVFPKVQMGTFSSEKGDTTGGETLENKQSLTASNRDQPDKPSTDYLCTGGEACSLQDNVISEKTESTTVLHEPKRRRETEVKLERDTRPSFIRSPCEGLRPRLGKEPTSETTFNITEPTKKKSMLERVKKPSTVSSGHHRCNLEGCKMTFETKEELQMHKRNRCIHEGCGKKFRAHKYVVLHQRVHNDDRPFKCPWKECSMTFKWAWARTEHLRLHTGERPYKCKVEGCGLSFRFVSDFSRHRRKTGHYVN